MQDALWEPYGRGDDAWRIAARFGLDRACLVAQPSLHGVDELSWRRAVEARRMRAIAHAAAHGIGLRWWWAWEEGRLPMAGRLAARELVLEGLRQPDAAGVGPLQWPARDEDNVDEAMELAAYAGVPLLLMPRPARRHADTSAWAALLRSWAGAGRPLPPRVLVLGVDRLNTRIVRDHGWTPVLRWPEEVSHPGEAMALANAAGELLLASGGDVALDEPLRYRHLAEGDDAARHVRAASERTWRAVWGSA